MSANVLKSIFYQLLGFFHLSAMKSIGVNLLKQLVEEELSDCIGVSLR